MLKQSIISTVILSTLSLSSFAADKAVSIESNKTSKSISYQNKDLLKLETRTKMLSISEVDSTSIQLQNSLQPLANRTALHPSSDFSLYDVSTDLIIDDDHDGFYHRFSVTVDADTVYDHATVYADFYLSYEGGPWIYYATSDNYSIHLDSYNDTFTIETELADGYPTGYYDLRIKLYDAHTHDYLLSYDNYNDGSLTSIPLEDSYRDDYEYHESETEIVITHGAGSFNLAYVFALFIVLLVVRLVSIFKPSKD